MDIPNLQTARLVLRPWSEGDVDPLHRILGEEGVLAYSPTSSPPARASVRFGFETTAADEIVGIVHPQNAASRRVIEKLGMSLSRRAVYFGMDCERYALARPAPGRGGGRKEPRDERGTVLCRDRRAGAAPTGRHLPGAAAVGHKGRRRRRVGVCDRARRPGREFTVAVQREVREELGVAVRIDFIVGTDHFYRGEARPENELLGVVYRCTIDDPEAISVSWEHSERCWVNAAEAAERFPEPHWLGRLIRRAEALDGLSSEALLAYYRENGFEV